MPTSGSAPFLIVGFTLTWGAVALYAWRLESRLQSARDRLERRGEGRSRAPRRQRREAGEPGTDATSEEST